jgi:uncharacterized RDD family membrane protein YckC
MQNWWYASGEESVGPVGVDALRELAKQGRISQETLVWGPGLTEWGPLGAISELVAAVFPPPPLPGARRSAQETAQNPVPSPASASASSPSAELVHINRSIKTAQQPPERPKTQTRSAPEHLRFPDVNDPSQRTSEPAKLLPPDRPTNASSSGFSGKKVAELVPASFGQRAAARLTDLGLFGLLVGLASAALLQDATISAGALFLFLVFSSLSVFLLEGLFGGLFGNTPGKTLVGIRVVQASGELLLIGTWLWRSLLVWTRGFALGIPLFALVTVIVQAMRLLRRRPTSYDQGEFIVYRHKTSVWRTSLALVTGFFVYVVALVLVDVVVRLLR